ncbi:NAD(P)-binding protein [Thozetella sp. PMI_491]|nr:NAD(P)-binding protein [Thozetella sp. PMI_491]
MASNSTPSIRVAVIGVGLIGPRHAQSVKGNSDTELVAIVDPAPGSAVLAAEFGVPHFNSVADLLQAAAKPDAAIICTPNHTHVPIAMELASGGVHILVEKPISTDIASGEALLQHLSSNHVATLVGHHRRFNPYMVATKKTIDSGVLGNVIAISGLWTLRKPPRYFEAPTDWRRGTTGGVVLINMIHEVDLLHYLYGTIARVHAERTVSQRGFAAEEGAAITLRFQSGVVGTFLISDNVSSPYNFEAGTGENPIIAKAGQDCYRIMGSEATLSVPDMSLWSYRGKDEKSWHEEMTRDAVPVPEAVPFDLQLAHFVKVIRGEEKPSCTVQAALGALRVCQALREAIAQNSTVEIEPYSL